MIEVHHGQNYDKSRLRLRLAFMSILIGVLAGLAAVVYRFTLSKIDAFRLSVLPGLELWQIPLVILAFFAMAWMMDRLLRWAPYSGGSGIPQIRAELLGHIDMDSTPTMVSKFIGGSIGNIAGLTLGREGPSIQLGGMIAKAAGQFLGASPMEMRYLITAGASAGLAAAFNAPLSGALFAMEEVHKSLSHLFLVPCLIASLVANYVSFQILGYQSAFSFPIQQVLPIHAIPLVLLIGIVTGLFGSFFNIGLVKAVRGMKNAKISRRTMIFLIMLLLLPCGMYAPMLLGGGHGLIEALLPSGSLALPLLHVLAVRFLFVWLCYGSGAQGGIFLPVLTLGALVGAILYQLLGPIVGEGYMENFLYLGMVGILSAVVQAPLMSILLVTEMSGSITIMIAVTSCALVAYLTAKVCRIEPIYDLLYDMSFAQEEETEKTMVGNMTMQYFLLTNESPIVGQPLALLLLPPNTLIASISREKNTIVPHGKTALQGGDEILVLCPEEALQQVTAYFEG